MRFALGIEYDGTDFLGWQRLSHGNSVQGAVESALSFVAAHAVDVTCAGRTDAGVHARCQVVHFDSEATRTDRGWTLGANSQLPPTVAVIWAREVAEDFHARYSARAALSLHDPEPPDPAGARCAPRRVGARAARHR